MMAQLENVEDDPLREVPPEDIPEMLFRMRNNFPLAIHAHEYIRTIIRWKKKRPDLEMAILSPAGDFRKGVIFFTINEGQFFGSVFCNDDIEKIEIQKALATTKKVPLFSQKITTITCLTSTSYEAIKPTMSGWDISENVVYWLPWYCAREIDIHLPEGVEIRQLDEEHADQMNEVWPHKYPGSRDVIAEMIKVNFGLGVFRGKTLLSWAVHWFYGGIGVVQTVDHEKRKGYGRAVVEAMTKRLGEMQTDVHLNIVGGNKVAETFFKSIGFRFGFCSYWFDK